MLADKSCWPDIDARAFIVVCRSVVRFLPVLRCGHGKLTANDAVQGPSWGDEFGVENAFNVARCRETRDVRQLGMRHNVAWLKAALASFGLSARYLLSRGICLVLAVCFLVLPGPYKRGAFINHETVFVSPMVQSLHVDDGCCDRWWWPFCGCNGRFGNRPCHLEYWL